MTINEPRQIAVQAAIDEAVRALIIEGADLDMWDFTDRQAQEDLIVEYREKQFPRREIPDAALTPDRPATKNAADVIQTSAVRPRRTIFGTPRVTTRQVAPAQPAAERVVRPAGTPRNVGPSGTPPTAIRQETPAAPETPAPAVPQVPPAPAADEPAVGSTEPASPDAARASLTTVPVPVARADGGAARDIRRIARASAPIVANAGAVRPVSAPAIAMDVPDASPTAPGKIHATFAALTTDGKAVGLPYPSVALAFSGPVAATPLAER